MKKAKHIEVFCEMCEQELTGKITWLEFSNTDSTYYKKGHVPADHESLGLYSFGADCARRKLAQGEEERAELALKINVQGA